MSLVFMTQIDNTGYKATDSRMSLIVSLGSIDTMCMYVDIVMNCECVFVDMHIFLDHIRMIFYI